jgi:hypothetical protein
MVRTRNSYGNPAYMRESSGKRPDSPVRKLPQQKKENHIICRTAVEVMVE